MYGAKHTGKNASMQASEIMAPRWASLPKAFFFPVNCSELQTPYVKMSASTISRGSRRSLCHSDAANYPIPFGIESDHFQRFLQIGGKTYPVWFGGALGASGVLHFHSIPHLASNVYRTSTGSVQDVYSQ